ncbi:ATP10B, partial [Cordylochernes scorpioides]
MYPPDFVALFAGQNWLECVSQQRCVRESARYVKTRWQDVRVGDLVHLSCNEAIPADIVLLRSKDPLGLCYLETASLDGESSLKQRQTPHFLPQHKEIYEVAPKFHLECEVPNNRIYHFIGCIVPENSERIPLNKENLLLRDCRVKNADFVEGIVVYAGHDTKTMLNNKGPRYKRSKLECFMNRDVIWCIFLLLIICMGGAIGTILWELTYPPNDLIPYFQTGEQNLGLSGFYAFLSYIIIFQVIIPISLYVTIEIIKLGQVYLVEQDIDMPGVRCRALNIPEELGQVEVVLSDKTGTLTENCMVFRSCSILGMDFPHY